MTLQPDAVFIEGLDFFTAAVGRLDTSDWERRSPCEGWRALDVLGHVGAAVEFETTGSLPLLPPLQPTHRHRRRSLPGPAVTHGGRRSPVWEVFM